MPTDVFISYSRERRAVVRHLAITLGLYGYEVWYDEAIELGHDYTEEIARRIRQARVTVVLWCKHSVESTYVGNEANLARRCNNMMPVLLEAVEPRFPFAEAQTYDLSRWDGSPSSPVFLALVDKVSGKVRRKPKADDAAIRKHLDGWTASGSPSLARLLSRASGEEEAPASVRTLLLPVDGEVVVGRDADQCTEVIAHPDVSKKHASLRFMNGVCWVRDEGSTNGTFVDGVRIKAGVWVAIPQHRLAFGPWHCDVRAPGLPSTRKSDINFQLIGNEGTHEILAGDAETRFGRDSERCELVSSDSRVSGLHATLRVAEDGLTVRDENSSNGVYIDGERIQSGAWVRVDDGARLRFATVEFSVRAFATSRK